MIITWNDIKLSWVAFATAVNIYFAETLIKI
jgi:hypothetical protein